MDTAKDAFTNEGYEYFVREGRVDEEGKIVFGDKVYTSNVTGNAEDGFIITNIKKKTTSDASTNTEKSTTNTGGKPSHKYNNKTNNGDKENSHTNSDNKSKNSRNNSINTDNKPKDKDEEDSTKGYTATSQGKSTTGKSNIPNTGDRSLIVEFLSCILLLSAFVFLSRKEDIK